MNKQQFSGILDGGSCKLEFYTLCKTEAEVATFPLSLVMIGQILKKEQQLFEIQDGGCGCHHLEFR